MSSPVIWFEIYVQDMDRAKTFYQSVFELKLERINAPDLEMWGFPMNMESVGAGGALVKMEGVEPRMGGTLVYFACADCAVQEARVVKFGGKVHKAKMSIGEHGFISLVYDTEGNMFGLHSMD